MNSSTIDLNAPISEIVRAQPELARRFDELGVKYCCTGGKTLADVCAQTGLGLSAVLGTASERTIEPGEAVTVGGVVAVEELGLTDLTRHIEATHHAYLRRELPRLGEKAERVSQVHGERDMRLRTLAQTLALFAADLHAHMMKEERILFPAIRAMEGNGPAVGCPFASIAQPIQAMEMEHEHAGDALRQMRFLTDGFNPPDWACNTYRVLLYGLDELDRDMEQHVHAENDVLFPRAIALESEQGAGRG